MEKLKIAMGQLLVEGGEPERNLDRARKMVEQAAQGGASIIVLPETVDFAWTHPSSLEEALPIPGEYSYFFCKLAKENNIFICVGLTEKQGEKLFNTALLIKNDGSILLKYSKINLLDVEQPFYSVGSSLEVVSTPFGVVGVNICADNYRNSVHIAKTLGSMGAELILSPSSWTVGCNITEEDDPYSKKWIEPISYIAKMYDLTFISVTSVGYIVGGPYEGKKQIGCSLAVDSSGVIKQGQFNEFAGEVVFVDVDIKKRKEQGTDLNKKIEEKGFTPEIDLWNKNQTT